jgi:hypothetical protein
MKKLFSITLLLLILCGCGDDEVNLPFTEPETDWNLSFSEMESQYQDIITETFSTDENIVLGDFGIPGGRLMGVTAFLYIEKNGLQTRYYFNEERKLICSQIMINTDEDIYDLLEKKYGPTLANSYTWERGNCIIGVRNWDIYFHWSIGYSNPSYIH